MKPTVRIRPRRGTRKSTVPQPTQNLVAPLFSWLKLDENARSFRAMKAFWDAAGPRIRAHARGERLRGATLFVRVESAAWSHELGVLKPALLDKLRKTAGGEIVKELRFNVGPLDEVPDWSVPTARARQELLPEVPQPIPADVERALESLTDPELRDKLSHLVQRLGVRRKPG